MLVEVVLVEVLWYWFHMTEVLKILLYLRLVINSELFYLSPEAKQRREVSQ